MLLAMAGEWVAHAATWYLTGGATPGHALSGSAHTYLRPVGLGLVGLAVLASWSVWRGLQRLVEVATSLRAAARESWRQDLSDAGGPPAGRPVELDARWVRPGRLWSALLAVQLVVYFAQENVEARAMGFAFPGVHVLTAHHGSALAVHAMVALLAAMLAVEVCDRWRERTREVIVAAGVYRAVTWRRSAPAIAAPGWVAPVDRLLDRVGRSILSRPPPGLLSV